MSATPKRVGSHWQAGDPRASAAAAKGGRLPDRTRITREVENRGRIWVPPHLANLERVKRATTNERHRRYLDNAMDVIRHLTELNRRLGSKVGAMKRRKSLTERGVQITIENNTPEQIAEEICEIANHHRINVYVFRRCFRVTTAEIPRYVDTPAHLGAYTDAADYRVVVEDVKAALERYA